MLPKKKCLYIAIFSAALLLLIAAQIASADDYQVLHNFTGGANDGAEPRDSLILYDSQLYGMTTTGGPGDQGVVFRLNTDGDGFQLLHQFAGAPLDGQRPCGSLHLSGSTFYGTTWGGGASNTGAIFSLNSDGSGYQLLHSCGSNANRPMGSLVSSGLSLYGITPFGGTSNLGTIYKLNTNGTGFQVLHNFTGGLNDGKWSHGSLIQIDDALYGLSTSGGTNDNGIVFKISADGKSFQILHKFVGGVNDGKWPYFASLFHSESKLYGMTQNGGTNDKGTVFRLNLDGTGFELLHSFAGGNDDGATPLGGALIQSGSILYGMTSSGGSNDYGTVFKINSDGSDFALLHAFTGSDGRCPYGSLLLSGSTLYGMTFEGGSQDKGVIFALTVPEPNLVKLQLLLAAIMFPLFRKAFTPHV